MTIDIHIPEGTRKQRNSYSINTTPQDNYKSCFQNYYHGHNYLNPNPKYITNANAIINHFQLRDLLQVDQGTGDIYFTKNYSLWKLHQDQEVGSENYSISSEIVKPDYAPKCFNVTNNGVAVIGGLLTSAYSIYYSNIEGLSSKNQISKPQKGLFSFYNSRINASKTVKLGEMINNSVLIDGSHSNNNQYKSYVCNNDSSLYVLDIMNNDKISIKNKIQCEHDVSLNNAVNSPTTDKLIAVTGDTSSIFLVDPTCGNSPVQKLKTKHDSGFGISFHPNGKLLSVAFQDGNCLLYDLRNLSDPLHNIKSTRPSHQSGGFRSCKFSSSKFSDILAISEHVGRVHLIDLRNLNDQANNHQVVVFPFALDQFGEYNRGLQKEHEMFQKDNDEFMKENDGERNTNNNDNNSHDSNDNKQNGKLSTMKHYNVPIYDDIFQKNDVKFNAPLVYDYDYLTNVNPKLFKYYTYQPNTKTCDQIPHTNAYRSLSVSPGSSPTDVTSTMEYNLNDNMHDLYNFPRNMIGSSAMNSNSTYQNANNHIHGEMEISGFDWYDSKLLIGCEYGGIMSWDVNYIARRSFGSFSFV